MWLEELSENLSFTSDKNDVSLNIKVKNCTTWKLYISSSNLPFLGKQWCVKSTVMYRVSKYWPPLNKNITVPSGYPGM